MKRRDALKTMGVGAIALASLDGQGLQTFAQTMAKEPTIKNEMVPVDGYFFYKKISIDDNRSWEIFSANKGQVDFFVEGSSLVVHHNGGKHNSEYIPVKDPNSLNFYSEPFWFPPGPTSTCWLAKDHQSGKRPWLYSLRIVENATT